VWPRLELYKETCDRATSREDSLDSSSLGRIIAGLVMGGLPLFLLGLTQVLEPMGVAAVVHPWVQAVVPVAAIVTVLIAALSSIVRTTCGRLCLMNGVVTLALAGASVENGQPRWPTDPVYERALDQAMQGWLRHIFWTTAAYSAAVLIMAAILFALSYWLLHSPRVRHRQAH
jgi:hypothetical protein